MKEYKQVRALTRTFRILGWVVFAGSFVIACGAMIFGPTVANEDALTAGILATAGFLVGPAILVNGLVFSALLFFAAELLELLTDISGQTFETKELLRRALARPEPASAPPKQSPVQPYQTARP